jgi:SPP1 gp7 family putative phage head morphogenesis protein
MSIERAALTLRRLGREAPKPGPARIPPPKPMRTERVYYARVRAMLRMWYARAEEIGRAALSRSDASRVDAVDDDLRAAWKAIEEAGGIGAWLTTAGKDVANANARYVERVTRIPPAAPSGRQAQIEEFRQRGVRLITNLGEDQIQAVADILRPAQAIGQRWEAIAPLIQDRLGISDRRARLIARDQTNKFNGEMARLTQTEAGITKFKWQTSGDLAVRGRPGGVYAKSKENHWALHGTIHEYANPPIIPGTSERAIPGQRIACRCQAIPVVPLFEGTSAAGLLGLDQPAPKPAKRQPKKPRK